MNPPGSVSTASSNKTEQQLQLALPLAAIISLSITCYVIAVVVGKKSITYKYFMIHDLYIHTGIFRYSCAELANKNVLLLCSDVRRKKLRL